MRPNESLTYVFQDDAWFSKVFCGGLALVASTIGIGLPYLIGYFETVMKNLAGRNPEPLPSWTPLRNLFLVGYLPACVFAMEAGIIWYISDSIGLAVVCSVGSTLGYLWIKSMRLRGNLLKPPVIEPMKFLHEIIRCSFGLSILGLSMLLGWMALVAFWPLVVFWGVLVFLHSVSKP